MLGVVPRKEVRHAPPLEHGDGQNKDDERIDRGTGIQSG